MLEHDSRSMRELTREEFLCRVNSGDGGLRARPMLSGQVERDKIDVEARTLEVSFSSEETAVEQWWGYEILDHTPGSIDFERFEPKNLGAVLVQHDRLSAEAHIGVVLRAWLDSAARKCRALVRFSRSELATMVLQDIQDGIRGNVSVGYDILDYVLERQEKDRPPLYRVTRWAPYEISIVSVPADIRVGVGRSIDVIPAMLNERKESRVVPPKEDVHAETIAQSTVQVLGDDREQRERARGAEIMGLAKQVVERTQDHSVYQIATEFIASGRSADQFRQVMFERMLPDGGQIHVADAPIIGMTERETRRYRVNRLMRALVAEPGERTRLERDAAFEFECSRAFAKLVGRDPRSAWIPTDVLEGSPDRELAVAIYRQLRSTRDILVSGTGQYLVPTDLQSGSFVELLYSRSLVMGLATVLTGLNGNVAIPKQTGGASLYWITEGGTSTETTPTFGQIALTPKSATAMVDYSRKFFLQTSIGAEALIRADFIKRFGVGIDTVALEGGGSNEPQGILYTGSGVTDVSMGTPNGGTLTWGKVVEFETAISVANADAGRLAYITNAKVRGQLKIIPIVTAMSDMLWDRRDKEAPVNGYPCFVTNCIRSTFVEGTSGATLSGMIFGNWEDLLIGMWGGLDIFVNPYVASGTGNVRIEAYQSVDVALRRTESFAASRDIITV